MKNNPQSGNVLFYILFAIALLAGLTFAVNRGGQVSTATLSADQARVAASEILDYAGAVSGAVTKLKLRGCTETQSQLPKRCHRRDLYEWVVPHR
jgi:hypothetical protein